MREEMLITCIYTHFLTFIYKETHLDTTGHASYIALELVGFDVAYHFGVCLAGKEEVILPQGVDQRC